MLKEFQSFINRGNVVQLAVAVIIGAAFSKITDSLTNDIIMPVVGAVFGGLDFSNYFYRLGPIPATFHGNARSYVALKAAGVAVFGWREFLTVTLNFVILAVIIFLMVRAANRAFERTEEESPSGPSEVDLLVEIRDELKKRPR